MRFLCVTVFLFCLPLGAEAQNITGRVLADVTGEPIADVIIANKSTSEATSTDSLGYYTIPASSGDMLLFYRLGYTTHRQQVNCNHQVTTMKLVDTTLSEVVIIARSYKLDSTERAIIYGRGLREARKTIHVTLSNGIVFHNLPSQFAKRITGRLKREKHFLKQFEEGEQEKFIVTRYNITVVSKVTGLQGDDAAHFMNAYPMAHDYARVATDLEVYAWIKNNYKQYRNKEKRKP